MDKYHFSGPQSEKLNCVDDLFGFNLHGRIVLVRFPVVKRKAITTARIRRQTGCRDKGGAVASECTCKSCR